VIYLVLDIKKIDGFAILYTEGGMDVIYKILLIEDDLDLQEIISDYFGEKSKEEIVLTCITNGTEALLYASDSTFDLVLLDVMLPEVDGFTICREFRKHNDLPIMFLTARQEETDRLHGYSLGCDDYIVKPFSNAELYAKANALIRRAKGIVREAGMTVGQIRLDIFRCTVFVDETEIVLAPKEFSILRLLMENRGHVVSREALLVNIWGYDSDVSDRVIDNHVKKLRKALGKAAGQVKTVVKNGYKLEE